MKQREEFPLLLKRTHFINDIGISNAVYYQLIHSGSLPVVIINDRKYVLRDKFFDMLESGSIFCSQEA